MRRTSLDRPAADLEGREAEVFDRSDIDLLIERSMAGSGLLDELACGMCSSDEALAWDCAELLRRVAQSKCVLVEPYRSALEACVQHPSEHVRLEAEAALEAVRRCRVDSPEVVEPARRESGDGRRHGRWRRALEYSPRGRHAAN
jgi:hypothetical protein